MMKYIVNIVVDIKKEPTAYTSANCLKVLKAIKAGEQVSTSQIGDRTGLHYFTALRRLNDLIKEGKVKKVGKSYKARYQLYD